MHLQLHYSIISLSKWSTPRPRSTRTKLCRPARNLGSGAARLCLRETHSTAAATGNTPFFSTECTTSRARQPSAGRPHGKGHRVANLGRLSNSPVTVRIRSGLTPVPFLAQLITRSTRFTPGRALRRHLHLAFVMIDCFDRGADEFDESWPSRSSPAISDFKRLAAQFCVVGKPMKLITAGCDGKHKVASHDRGISCPGWRDDRRRETRSDLSRWPHANSFYSGTPYDAERSTNINKGRVRQLIW